MEHRNTHLRFLSFLASEDAQVSMADSIMMLVKFLTSANQKHWIWSGDKSGLCNPRPRLFGDEIVVGSSLMFREMDPRNVIRKYTAGQD